MKDETGDQHHFAPADTLLACGVGIAALGCDIACLCPTVGPGDAGELTTCAVTLGIAHPPGYPFFSALGRLATLSPLEPALAANLLTAGLGAGTVSLLYLALRASRASRLGAAIGSLVLAVSRTFWAQSTYHEAYTMGILLLCAAILAAGIGTRNGLLFAAYAFGLALAHQPTALLWFPALVALAWPKSEDRTIGVALLYMLSLALGVSSVLMTLVRSGAGPELNWGDPSTVGRFIAHYTGAQYSGLAAHGAPGLLQSRVSELPGTVLAEVGPGVVLLALVGVVSLAQGRRRLLAALLFLAATAGFALTYNVPDYRVCLLPATTAVAMMAGHGVTWLSRRFFRSAAPHVALAALVVLAAPGYLLVRNFSLVSEARTTLIRDLGWNLLESLPRDAVFISASDVGANSVHYLQYSAALRRDVLVVQAEMLFSAQYLDWLAARLGRPEVVAKDTGPPDTTRAQRLLWLVEAVASVVGPSRPVCLGPELIYDQFYASSVALHHQAVPSGIVARLAPLGEDIDAAAILLQGRETWSRFRLRSAFREYRLEGLRGFGLLYATCLNNSAMFYFQAGARVAAAEDLKKALTFPLPPETKQNLKQNLERVESGSG